MNVERAMSSERTRNYERAIVREFHVYEDTGYSQA